MEILGLPLNQVLLLIAVGIVAGTVSGMLGVGSGIILVPAMVILVALPQKVAQGTALAVMVPMALVGASRYIANPAIDVNLGRVALLAVGAIGGAVLGAAIAVRLPGPVLRKIFAIFLLVVAARMLFQRPRKPAATSETGIEACCGAPPTG